MAILYISLFSFTHFARLFPDSHVIRPANNTITVLSEYLYATSVVWCEQGFQNPFARVADTLYRCAGHPPLQSEAPKRGTAAEVPPRRASCFDTEHSSAPAQAATLARRTPG
jgi:hypothetical protein